MEKKILLVEISAVDKKPLVAALNALGYTTIEITLSEINTARTLPMCHEKFNNSCLMIVDAQKGRGQEVIKEINNAQKNLFTDTAVHLPILAIIDSSKSNKHLLFDLGAFDYISSPLIPAELNLRITYAADSFAAVRASLDAMPKSLASPSFIQQRTSQLAESTAQYLKSRLHEDIKFTVLIITMGTNRNKLNEAFKTFYGMTVFAWFHVQRMAMAETLLKTTTLSILQVGEQVGYPNSSNFSTAFKREFKFSPKHYRKLLP
jgi:AraC-like DNA-binding protein